MAAVASLGRTLNHVSKRFLSFPKCVPRNISAVQPCLYIHSTAAKRNLMEFFDEPKNWGQNEVKVGRSWKKEELRLKSNSDLHKLWFLLLKEKNMLLTMEHECKEQTQVFPNPERIDKVQDTMKNLEDVVRERNEAYFKLETGETGERPGYLRTGQLGLKHYYRTCEHYIPKFMNTGWQRSHKIYSHTVDVRNFIKLYREKLYIQRKRAENREKNDVIGLLRRFPNLDEEAVKEQFPSVKFDKVRCNKRARGHRENLY